MQLLHFLLLFPINKMNFIYAFITQTNLRHTSYAFEILTSPVPSNIPIRLCVPCSLQSWQASGGSFPLSQSSPWETQSHFCLSERKYL